MSVSKKDPSRKEKLNAFKEQAKKQAQQQSIPKNQLIPTTDWNDDETLEIPGNFLKALEQYMVGTYQNLTEARSMLNAAQAEFTNAGRIMQSIIGRNIDAGKISLDYVWNNGEDATPEEVAEYQKQLAQLQELQKQKSAEAQKLQNAAKTGLVTSEGEPLGSTQDLDSDLEALADQSRAAADQDTDEKQPESAVDGSTVAE
jgi:hypothetical protein